MAVAALSPLLNLLSTFLSEESTLLGGLRHEVQHIKDEFGQMKDFLRRAEALAETSLEVEAWVNQVRDVAYDAEDVLDEFNLKFGCHYDDTCLGLVQEAWSWIMKLFARHQLATEIQTIKGRIKNISEAHQRYQTRYGISEQGSSSVFAHNQNTWYDSRSEALFLEEANLVGIERPKKKLMDMLLSEAAELRVISVVGMGGLGKTTLVKKVYDDPDVKMRFKHHLWITVSQSFTIETLLILAIVQLSMEVNQPIPTGFDTINADSMRQCVCDFLHQEAYVVVLDNIWRSIDWDAIRMAFPRNNCGSRIIITSCDTRVGQAATSDIGGEIYPLECLNKEESWTLFCKKAFRASSCPQHLEQIARNILDKCVGLPLAIMVIGGIMARKSRSRTEEWDLFNRSMGEQLVQNSQLDNMINLSYYDLPDHLRTCFLYLSILPEDVSIDKTRLFRLWIAEGFVQKKEGMTMEEVAEDYLNELINRSLVQIDKTTIDGLVEKCRVHDIIQKIILHKAKEQGITTILSGQRMQIPNKVRRLVIHTSYDNIQVRNGLLKGLRSLVLFESIGYMPFLSMPSFDDLRLLNVLELKGAPLKVIADEIFKLFHLKYLGLSETLVTTVPKSIGKLQKLETLDLTYTKVRKLPVEILKLQQLRHLLLLGYRFLVEVEVPYKLGCLQSLESLDNIVAGQMGDIKIVKEVGKLTHLRLGISKLRREDGKEFCSSLERLLNLRELSVVSINEEEVLDLQYSLSSTPRFLRLLKLEGRLEKPPQWISSLQGLTAIHLNCSRLRDDPLPFLQDLPNLMELHLVQAYEGEGLCFKAGGFQGLKLLWLSSLTELRWIRVENGAMPLLKTLYMLRCMSLEELPTGIKCLTNLQHVDLHDMPMEITNWVDKWRQRKLSTGTNLKHVDLHDMRMEIRNWIWMNLGKANCQRRQP